MSSMTTPRPDASLPTGLGAALDRVGDRWSLQVVEALLGGPLRYGELTSAVAGIAPNILADRLRKLERAGILASTPYSQRPVRLEYALTTDGHEGSVYELGGDAVTMPEPTLSQPTSSTLAATAAWSGIRSR